MKNPRTRSDPAPFEESIEARRRAGRIRGKGSLLAVAIEGRTAGVVQAGYGGGRARIQRWAVVPLECGDDTDRPDARQIGAGLSSGLSAAKLRGSQTVFVIPRGQVVLRPLIVPFPADWEELSAMVHLQVSKDLPFKLDEAVIDYKVLRVVEPVAGPDREGVDGATDGDRGGEGVPVGANVPAHARVGAGSPADDQPAEGESRRLEVLVGAVRRELCVYYQTVAQAAGLRLAGLVLRSHAGARLLMRVAPAPEDGAAALVTLSPTEITIDVVVGNLLVFSRMTTARLPETGPGADREVRANPAAGAGGSPTTEAGAAPAEDTGAAGRFLSALATEYLRSSASFDGMMWRRPIKAVHVAGDTGWEDRVIEHLGERIGLPVHRLDPGEAVGPARPAGSGGSVHGALAAVGAALYYEDPAGPPLEFLHPKRPPVRRDLRRLKVMLALAAGLAVLIGLLGTRRHLINQQVRVRKALEVQVADAESKLPVYRRLQAQAGVVRAWMEDGRGWLDHLALLSGTLPGADDLYVTSFATTAQGLIRMSVQARSSDLLVDLDKRLRAAGYDVRPLSITPGNDRYGYPFRTTVELAIPARMRVDHAALQVPPRPLDDTPVTPP